MTGPSPGADRAAFVRAHTAVAAPPHVPEIRLHLADEATELWFRTEEELGEMGLPPPFWAFAWAGGQALARYVLDDPSMVRGRRVFCLAAGCGIEAIAAAMAGAAHVAASEIDPFALAAIGLNGALNGVAVAAEDRDVLAPGERPPEADVVLAGDVFYERPMADRVHRWLADRARDGALVFVGDPGRSYLPRAALEPIATYEVPVTRALEDNEVKRTTVWRLPA